MRTWFHKRFKVALVLLALLAAAPSARAALSDLGPSINPHGYPVWFEDAEGLQLELCVPPPAGNATSPNLCIGDPLELDGEGNPVNPLVLTGESFWWMAAASVPTSVGDASVELAVEATFGGAEAAIDGQQISFGRTRIRIDTPVPGTYTVTYPHGTEVFEVLVAADGINSTVDIGAMNFLFPALAFQGTLAAFGPDPVPFLTWPDYDLEPTLQVRGLADPITGEPGPILEQYVGDPNVPHVVVGGTNGNIFRVDGPAGSNLDGLGNDFVETDLFTVMGKVYDPTIPFVVHEFPGVPEQNLFAVGPVNRETPFNPATTADITGQLYNYAYGYPLWYQEALVVLDPETGEPVLDPNTGAPLLDPDTGEPVIDPDTQLPVVDPETQSPLLEGGLQLTLCTPGDAMCISDPINFADQASVDFRTGGESFWWSADAVMDVPAGRAVLVLGIEGTFGGSEAILDGQQVSFGRVRIRVDTDRAGTYRVTHPYGAMIFENVPVDDNGINHTSDVGILDASDPDFGFAGTLYSEIGPTVLKWTTFVDPAAVPEGEPYPEPQLVTSHVDQDGIETGLFNYFVGNPGVEHEVTGSPFDTNFFRVEYLVDGTVENGNWDIVAETDLFAVSGKLYDPATFEFAINLNAPVAADDEAVLNMANASAAIIDVLANDTFDTTATVTVLPPGEAFGPATGTAVANLDGTVTYTPDAAFALDGGIDTFAYNIVDATGLASNNAVVTVTVVPVETLTVDRARLDTRRLRLEVRGTTNSAGPVTIYAGNGTGGTVLGTAIPRNNGSWNFRGTATTNLSNITAATANNTIVTSAVQAR